MKCLNCDAPARPASSFCSSECLHAWVDAHPGRKEPMASIESARTVRKVEEMVKDGEGTSGVL